jgi:hypothetical protein
MNDRIHGIAQISRAPTIMDLRSNPKGIVFSLSKVNAKAARTYSAEATTNEDEKKQGADDNCGSSMGNGDCTDALYWLLHVIHGIVDTCH